MVNEIIQLDTALEHSIPISSDEMRVPWILAQGSWECGRGLWLKAVADGQCSISHTLYFAVVLSYASTLWQQSVLMSHIYCAEVYRCKIMLVCIKLCQGVIVRKVSVCLVYSLLHSFSSLQTKPEQDCPTSIVPPGSTDCNLVTELVTPILLCLCISTSGIDSILLFSKIRMWSSK